MALRKAKGNMYDWVTHLWAPIKGKCSHECSYCYMKQDRQPPLHLDEKDLETKLGSGKFIFVCHTCDMFACDVPEIWIIKVLQKTCEYFENKYLFQTKNPLGIFPFRQYIPENSVFGTTIETNRNIVDSKAPNVTQRAYYLGSLSNIYETIVTIEPIFDFDLFEMVELIKKARPKWVNIGADSKHHNLPEPPPEKIKALIEALQEQTEVKLKLNLKRIYNEQNAQTNQ